MRPLRLISLVYLALLFSGCARPTVDIRTDLVGDVIWSGTVAVHGDVIVPKGSLLTIRPGTHILFYPAGKSDRFTEHPHFTGSELIVKGKVIAEGTADEPILFAFHEEGAPAGSWGGINVMESEGSSFAHAVFRQADSAIHSQLSRLYVEQSLFENNLVGIRFHSSEILIENNLLRKNDTAIRFHFGAPVICKNDIVDNGKGFFVTSHPSDYLIENNSILGNERSVVLGEEVPDDVVMGRNYWGTTDLSLVRSGFYDGQQESYLGRVLIEPLRSEPDPQSGVQWNR